MGGYEEKTSLYMYTEWKNPEGEKQERRIYLLGKSPRKQKYVEAKTQE